MFNRVFWKDLLERVIATYLQSFVGLLLATSGGLVSFGAVRAAAVSAIPATLAVIKAIVASRVGDPNTGSIVKPTVNRFVSSSPLSYQKVLGWELLRHRKPRKGTQALYDVILFLFSDKGARGAGIYNRRFQRGGSSWSTHAVGRAGDIWVPARSAIGDWIAGKLVARAEQLGVCEVIWNHKRWTVDTGWLSYNGVNKHEDHVHWSNTISFADSDSPRDDLTKWCAHHLTN